MMVHYGRLENKPDGLEQSARTEQSRIGYHRGLYVSSFRRVFTARLAVHTALRRNGIPEDVASTVAWLLSDDTAFVTGQEISVDGGFTIGGLRL